MCKINCSGGCIDCAPEEWWEGWWWQYFQTYLSYNDHYAHQGAYFEW